MKKRFIFERILLILSILGAIVSFFLNLNFKLIIFFFNIFVLLYITISSKYRKNAWSVEIDVKLRRLEEMNDYKVYKSIERYYMTIFAISHKYKSKNISRIYYLFKNLGIICSHKVLQIDLLPLSDMVYNGIIDADSFIELKSYYYNVKKHQFTTNVKNVLEEWLKI